MNDPLKEARALTNCVWKTYTWSSREPGSHRKGIKIPISIGMLVSNSGVKSNVSTIVCLIHSPREILYSCGTVMGRVNVIVKFLQIVWIKMWLFLIIFFNLTIVLLCELKVGVVIIQKDKIEKLEHRCLLPLRSSLKFFY